MQPYQLSSQESQRQGKIPIKTAATIGSTALTLGAPNLISKAMSFFSPYIPQNLAVKGLSKLDPRFGSFINNFQNNGGTEEEALNFVKGKLDEATQTLNKPPQQRNIVQQYSDKLNQFLETQIKKGKTPIEAAKLARGIMQFDPIIKKMEKDHKTNFLSIIESIYGLGEQAPGGQPQAESGIQQTPQQGTGQPGPGQQALMAILSKINQKIGGMNQ